MSKKLSKSLNSALTSLTTRLQSVGKTNQNVRRTRRRNRRRRIPFPGYVRTLPSAFVRTPVAKFSTRSVENGILVNGSDLVYEIPSSISKLKDKIFAVIPSNPLYWIGTRLSSIANMYQNYRPLRFQVHYIPQVAVTQPGTVIMGTLWDNTSSRGNLQKTLITSNGGLSCPCYSPASTNVRLATNLSMNLYRVHETGTYDSVPFYFLATMAGGDVIPGYFFVTYSYVFKNAMGSSWVADTYSTTIGELPVKNTLGTNKATRKIGQNASLITLESTVDSKGNPVPAGTSLAIETVSGVVSGATGSYFTHVLKENGSEKSIPPTTPAKVFENSPGTTQQEEEKKNFTMSLQVAYKVPNTTGPTNILPSDLITACDWVGFGPLVPQILKDSGSTIIYGRPALVGDYFKEVDIQISIPRCSFTVLIPVLPGGAVKTIGETTYSSTFEKPTLVCLTTYLGEGSGWNSIGKLIIPSDQKGIPILLISKSVESSLKQEVWSSFGTSSEMSNFTNITTSNTSLRTFDLSDYDTSSALNSLSPQEMLDVKTSLKCSWIAVNYTPYSSTASIATSSLSIFQPEARIPEAASSSDY